MTLNGVAVAGTVTFTPSANRIVDQAALMIIVPASRVVTLDSSGSLAVDLPATNDPDVNPIGFTYTVSENFPAGGGLTYSIAVPQGTTTDLSTVVAVDANAGTITTGGGTGAPGPAGPAGPSLLTGFGAPSSGLGIVGDTYIDKTTPSTIYGPKTSGGWGSGTPITSSSSGATLGSALPLTEGTATAGSASFASREDHVHPPGAGGSLQLGSTLPIIEGTAAVGVAATASHSDHVHPAYGGGGSGGGIAGATYPLLYDATSQYVSVAANSIDRNDVNQTNIPTYNVSGGGITTVDEATPLATTAATHGYVDSLGATIMAVRDNRYTNINMVMVSDTIGNPVGRQAGPQTVLAHDTTGGIFWATSTQLTAMGIGGGGSGSTDWLGGHQALFSTANFLPSMQSEGYNSTPIVQNNRSNGTATAQTAVAVNDSLGQYAFAGHDGGSFHKTAYIGAYATENFSTGHWGSALRFWTTAKNSTLGPVARMFIDDDGHLAMNNVSDAKNALIYVSTGTQITTDRTDAAAGGSPMGIKCEFDTIPGFKPADGMQINVKQTQGTIPGDFEGIYASVQLDSNTPTTSADRTPDSCALWGQAFVTSQSPMNVWGGNINVVVQGPGTKVNGVIPNPPIASTLYGNADHGVGTTLINYHGTTGTVGEIGTACGLECSVQNEASIWTDQTGSLHFVDHVALHATSNGSERIMQLVKFDGLAYYGLAMVSNANGSQTFFGTDSWKSCIRIGPHATTGASNGLPTGQAYWEVFPTGSMDVGGYMQLRVISGNDAVGATPVANQLLPMQGTPIPVNQARLYLHINGNSGKPELVVAWGNGTTSSVATTILATHP